MKRKAGNNWSSLQQAFADVDTDHSGTIVAEELRRVLSLWSMEVSDAHFAGLMKRWDIDSSGTLDYREFLMLFMEGGLKGNAENSMDTEDVEAKANSELYRRQSYANDPKGKILRGQQREFDFAELVDYSAMDLEKQV